MNLFDGPHELLDCDERLLVVRQGRAAGTDVLYVDGVPHSAHPPTHFSIVCTVQPMGGKDLLMMPESFRDKESLWLWQRYEGALAGGRAMEVGDIVVRLGRGYQVQTAEDWGSYARCALVAIDLGAYQGLVDPERLPDVYPVAP